MAKTLKDEEERIKRIYDVYECIIKGMSTRECADYITYNQKYDYTITNATVKDYIDRMAKIDGEKYNEMQDIIEEHTPKTVTDEEVKTRIKNVVINLAAGYNYQETADLLGLTYSTVYRDYTHRLNKLTTKELNDLGITNEVLEQINNMMLVRTQNNLKQGNDTYLTQERDEEGRFRR